LEGDVRTRPTRLSAGIPTTVNAIVVGLFPTAKISARERLG